MRESQPSAPARPSTKRSRHSANARAPKGYLNPVFLVGLSMTTWTENPVGVALLFKLGQVQKLDRRRNSSKRAKALRAGQERGWSRDFCGGRGSLAKTFTGNFFRDSNKFLVNHRGYLLSLRIDLAKLIPAGKSRWSSIS